MKVIKYLGTVIGKLIYLTGYPTDLEIIMFDGKDSVAEHLSMDGME